MTTFIVNNNNDSGVGSLRQAIADANAAIGSDTIEFDNSLSGQQITLTSGELQITDDLTINGLGADLLTVSGNNTDRVFLIDDEDGDIAIDVAFNGLTITQGNSDEGGGIRNRENLILTNSNIANNTGTGISNGGYSINSGSDLTVTNSSVTNNSSTGISHSYGSLAIRNSIVSDNLGWGIGSGNSGTEITQSTISGNGNGGIASGMTVLIMTDSAITDNTGSGFVGNRVNFEIDNSVISENTTTDSGGGIAGSYYFSGSISNSKITNNIADSDGDGDGNGGGVAGVPADILFTNTIIAGNFDNSPAGSEQYPDISGPGFGSNGYNFVGDVTGIRSYNPFTETGDLFGTSANPLSLSQIIEGTPGNDYLEGTAGMDRIAGGNGNDTLRGRGGIDVLLGEAGHDRLFGDGGENTLSGGVGDDQLFGGVDNDYLEGGDGNDTVYGGAGDDQLFGNSDDDRLVGNDGNDSIYGGAGVDILVGQNGHDYLEGNDGNDTLYGGAGNDQLFGNNHNDRLVGGDGDDTLYGGTGQDVLNGDAGSDRFVLVSGVSADQDIIRDYQDGVDRLILTGDLSFNDLEITQSGSNTRIREAATNQTLAILNGTDFNDLNQHDFEFGAGLNGIRVEAEDYVHFSDTTAGNTGGVYRNDNVDLEVTTDIGGGFNVGWIADGEWLTYNVNLATSGSYQVVARVASNTTDGRVHHLDVSLDGQSTTLDFDATGGWQSWTDISGGNLNLSAGSHELRLDMGSSGFNINYVDLIPVDESAISSFASNELLGSELSIVDDTLADF